MICRQCGIKLVKGKVVDHGECVNVDYNCEVHGLQVVTSVSKLVYLTSGGHYVDKNFRLEEYLKETDEQDKNF